ncbi:glyoxylase-like metal-dependent hydrolase (beta-lactamase superfamily II)/rhodanese-related sulfurtransferase [Mesonia hippocampi]|uniref:Glyoxylase-like metal-dependent hydrolase (Beta-lactamase superfamily II)/rhodanese-related sulfurtransferase n=1 Tax=Mesonia hippocampi TaxID=1628250 RepID=A0A840EW76_9FLAO|nr:MBL fold metallo-hydrolase [Mesonia hippocampi]MBB4119806.1 glyoxylase-like metal-dependent hydrolase (beta-lactamase superfamily II)/rhodanese-related sulfurtransferase [Mesonia hippocampi]
MIVEQIYTGCLAQGAYYIESNGEAVVIDPLREVQPYIDKAEKNNAKIKYVLETHFHADFVSGHLDLAKKTGAKIVFGPNAKPDFDAHLAKDNEQLKVGNLTITVIHTPGHTMESTCYLLSDENGKNIGIFTGDTLFIGDVGRPDLAQKVASDLTQEKLAGYLYDSLHNKILPLEDDIIVYPAHGAGSACGKNMSKETTDTLGNQRKTNYALQDISKEEFVKQVTDGLAPPPSYFPENVMMNIKGYESIDNVLNQGLQALSPAGFEAAANETNALILDTRAPQTFAKGFIPNAINIGIDGGFAPWVGTLILDIKQPILIVADPGREEEVVTRLARVGYDNSIGYLKGGFDAWKADNRETDSITSVTVDEVAAKLENNPDTLILDVRKKSEYLSERIKVAENLPLDFINENFTAIDKNKTYYVHCAGGYRSMIFTSILKARGYDNLIDVQGGFKAIKESNKFDLTDYVCPTTLL